MDETVCFQRVLDNLELYIQNRLLLRSQNLSDLKEELDLIKHRLVFTQVPEFVLYTWKNFGPGGNSTL